MKNIVIWGTGKKAKELVDNLYDCNIGAFAETRPRLSMFLERKVISINELTDIEYDLLIISPIESAEIKKYILHSKNIVIDKCVFLYISAFKDWAYWFEKYMMLDGIVDEEWLRKVLFEQNIKTLLYQIPTFVNNMTASTNKEVKKNLDYGQKNGRMQLINYPFIEKYIYHKYEIFIDKNNKLLYTIYDGVTFYFPDGWNKKKAIINLRDFLIRNDQESPFRSHALIKEKSRVLINSPKDVFYLINYRNKIRSIDIFKAENEWMIPLKETFSKIGITINFISCHDCFMKRQYSYIRLNIDDIEKRMEEIIENVFTDVMEIEIVSNLQLKLIKKVLKRNNYCIRKNNEKLVYIPQINELSIINYFITPIYVVVSNDR